MERRLLVAGIVSLALASPARAQFGGLLDSAKRQAEQSAKKAADDAVKGKPADPPPKAAAKQQPSQQAAPAEASTGRADAAAAAPPAGEVYGNRFDFVPGDKVLVYDDFSDTDVGEYPAKWTIKDGGGNQLEVVQVGDRRFLKSRYAEKNQDGATTWLRYAIKGDMPQNFTIEFDMDVVGPLELLFSKPPNWGGQHVVFHARDDTQVRSEHTNGKLPASTGIQHVAVAVSGTQVKVYVGGERVLADPDGVVRPIAKIGFRFMQPYRDEGNHQMFTSLRIAEGGKPAKQMLAGEGRIVTHGILFDTGSDVIKPESGPTLRNILKLMQDDAALRFEVQGHTDDQGGAKVNGPLSERRAAAVKAWLVKQGIEDARLRSKGLGDTKPLDSNETAEGRANNRRVEFVRLAGTT